jgi:hypothetical protein
MKKHFTTLVTGAVTAFLFLMANNSFAQNTVWPCTSCTTPVGIGGTAPPSKLSVIGGTTPATGFSVNYSDVHTTIYNQGSPTNAGVIQVYSGGSASSMGTSPYSLQLQPAGGNVGIGLSGVNPSFKLHVSGGDATGVISKFTNSTSHIYFFAKTNATGNYNGMNVANDNGIFWSDGVSSNTSSGFVIAPWAGATSGIRITAAGNVGIGTNLINNPNNYKLAVNGVIGAKAVKVEISTNTWADYVFNKDYKLKTLPELERFIKANNHLPNIPSAAEVEAEGIDMATMNIKLLEKIEELSLYIIEQNKRMDALEKKVDAKK